jgi:hypothetical protein
LVRNIAREYVPAEPPVPRRITADGAAARLGLVDDRTECFPLSGIWENLFYADLHGPDCSDT